MGTAFAQAAHGAILWDTDTILGQLTTKRNGTFFGHDHDPVPRGARLPRDGGRLRAPDQRRWSGRQYRGRARGAGSDARPRFDARTLRRSGRRADGSPGANSSPGPDGGSHRHARRPDTQSDAGSHAGPNPASAHVLPPI